MKYDLGYMDMYLFQVCGTCVENNPFFKVTLKARIDPIVLENAVYKAMKFHPLFATQLRYNKRYFLETNNRPIVLIHSEESARPKSFGTSTNGYPWQIVWFDNYFIMEWCHGITDGRGVLAFLKTVLCIYCGMSFPIVPRKVELGLGWEPFFDKKIQSKGLKKQPDGFGKHSLPTINDGYKTTYHTLSCDTPELLKISKKCESSVSSVLAVLLSKSIRKHLPMSEKNRNVACNVVIDLRKPLHYETMHNCDEFLRLTYQDCHEDMTFSETCKKYKELLDQYRIHENLIKIVTERVKVQKFIYFFRSKWMHHNLLKMIGDLTKDKDCNCQISYLGAADFPQEVQRQLADFQFRIWPDFGECTLAAVDSNGTFTINICENYVDKGIIEDFMQLSAANGIHWDHREHGIYEQSHFEEEHVSDKRRIRKKGSGKLYEQVLKPLNSPANFL